MDMLSPYRDAGFKLRKWGFTTLFHYTVDVDVSDYSPVVSLLGLQSWNKSFMKAIIQFLPRLFDRGVHSDFKGLILEAV